MRRSLGMLAVVLACSGGPALAGGWPPWLTLPSRQAEVSYPAVPAVAGEVPAMPSSCPSCTAGVMGHALAHGHGAPVGGYVDDNPLYPELAPWLFQKSHCRSRHCQGNCGGGHSSRHRWGQGEIPYVPPLPYGRDRVIGPPGASPMHQPFGVSEVVSPPPAAAPPAPAAPAPAPATPPAPGASSDNGFPVNGTTS